MSAEKVVATNTYSVQARRWAHGWELHIDDIGVTQSRTLGTAEGQVRDYVSLLLEVPEDTFRVNLVVHVGRPAERKVATALRLREAAERAEAQATEAAREAVDALASVGVTSVRDLGVVLKLSRRQVQRLLPLTRRAGPPGEAGRPS